MGGRRAEANWLRQAAARWASRRGGPTTTAQRRRRTGGAMGGPRAERAGVEAAGESEARAAAGATPRIRRLREGAVRQAQGKDQVGPTASLAFIISAVGRIFRGPQRKVTSRSRSRDLVYCHERYGKVVFSSGDPAGHARVREVRTCQFRFTRVGFGGKWDRRWFRRF
ncbi:uncharacterized protein A4U43_C06F6980 [Asparagus officinalis]|uniref:Uncharacterized protein n=1 Tax=Asparagus officinalis TaxID=4686 RepID=A0A5P1EK48_ASPOF|nr:uncharacterized protein A4U43_C06F6980 [Asparagus officinalis]